MLLVPLFTLSLSVIVQGFVLSLVLSFYENCCLPLSVSLFTPFLLEESVKRGFMHDIEKVL